MIHRRQLSNQQPSAPCIKGEGSGQGGQCDSCFAQQLTWSKFNEKFKNQFHSLWSVSVRLNFCKITLHDSPSRNPKKIIKCYKNYILKPLKVGLFPFPKTNQNLQILQTPREPEPSEFPLRGMAEGFRKPPSPRTTERQLG